MHLSITEFLFWDQNACYCISWHSTLGLRIQSFELAMWIEFLIQNSVCKSTVFCSRFLHEVALSVECGAGITAKGNWADNKSGCAHSR
jgi:hypothetical protein